LHEIKHDGFRRCYLCLVMLRIAATVLLGLLLLPGHSVRAAEPEEVMTFSCSGTAEANNTRRPVKEIRLIINTPRAPR